MARLIPVVIAVVAIAALTFVEGSMTERWADSRHCAYCCVLLQDVPKEIGSWTGEDEDVPAETQEVAGARGYVSRVYTNGEGDSVSVWLIVGHARDTADHQPTTCYGGQGFTGRQTLTRHSVELPDATNANFFTALFSKETERGPHQERVFWTWFHPKTGTEAPVTWIAPKNLRTEIAAAPALFKLYFTTSGKAAEPVDESICLDFAEEFLPVVNEVLARANGAIPDDFDASQVPAI